MGGSYHGSIFKDEYELKSDMFFRGAQLKRTIPTRQKTLIFNYSDIDEKNFCRHNHVIKGARILCADKLSSKEISRTSISKNCCLKTKF